MRASHGVSTGRQAVSYIIEVIDQRDIQKRGGDFTKYPSSYVVCSLLRKYTLRKVLDITYGEGRFYKLCFYDLEIVGVDPIQWNWAVKPKQFLQMNVFQLYAALKHRLVKLQQPDVVVIDPPKWNPSVAYRKRDMYNYIIGTPHLIVEYAIKVAELLKTKHLLIHYRELLEIENYKPIHIIEYEWFARYLNTDGKNKSLYILYEVVT
jgi:hypothetical protein